MTIPSPRRRLDSGLCDVGGCWAGVEPDGPTEGGPELEGADGVELVWGAEGAAEEEACPSPSWLSLFASSILGDAVRFRMGNSCRGRRSNESNSGSLVRSLYYGRGQGSFRDRSNMLRPSATGVLAVVDLVYRQCENRTVLIVKRRWATLGKTKAYDRSAVF